LATVYFIFLQAVIFLESVFPSEKRIDFLDSLVEKFLTPEPTPTQGELASLSDKEEISSIFLEVLKRTIICTSDT
jgi:pre-mRNA-processing factor 39